MKRKEKESYSPALDGIDHINIYSKGRTRLGRLLSNFAHVPMMTEDGIFASVEGYWYWLLADGRKGSDRLRELYGFKAKQYGRELGCLDWPSLDKEGFKNFQAKIIAALYAKVDECFELKDLLINSKLPFTHYYVFNDIVKNVTSGRWIIDAWEIIRMELQRNEHHLCRHENKVKRSGSIIQRLGLRGVRHGNKRS